LRASAPLSLADYQDFRAGGTLLAGMAVFAPMGANLTGEGDPQRLEGVLSTASVFELLGVQAAAGRMFTAADVAGRTLWLNGESYNVLGVLPADFFFPIREADFVVPLSAETDPRRTDRGDHFLSAVARLRPGAEATGRAGSTWCCWPRSR
jgi:putative ABC transport system permease protein